ncbi:hypothetical protein EJB05_57871, partial [Eragrostis curvula]
LPVGFHRFPSLSTAHGPQILEGRRFFLEPHLSDPSCPPHAAPLRRTARLRLLSAPLHRLGEASAAASFPTPRSQRCHGHRLIAVPQEHPVQRAAATTPVVSCSCSSVFVGPDADADTHSLSHHAAAHAIVKRADQGAQYTQANMGIAEASLVIDSHIWLSFCLTFSMFRYLDITVLFYAIHLFPEAESADDDVLNAGQLQIKKSYYRSLLSVNNKCARLQSLSYVGGKGCEPLAQLFSEMFRSV